MHNNHILIAAVVAVIAATSCASCRPGGATKSAYDDGAQLVGPAFCADSAYAYIAAQCAFGPRTMNSAAHDSCGEWIKSSFSQLGCDVTEQRADVKGYDGTTLHARNIMARCLPHRARRVLVCSHWDSRPWADNDVDTAFWHTPIDGADDGASGVGVMMELARLIQQDTTLAVGVDFVCFDAEDWGTPEWATAVTGDDTWALGAQHWAAHLPEDYRPAYGILLDMVGGEGARFYQEGVSLYYAASVVDKIWRTASSIGYGSRFPKSGGSTVNDDHVPLNTTARIPTVDIIPYYPDCPQSSFGPTWHTVDDNIAHIDTLTLKAVGQTLVQLLYSE